MANMTYKDAVNVAITALGDTNPEAVEKLNAMLVQLNKRGSGGGMTKTQRENEVLKGMILEILQEADAFIPPTDIQADDRMPDTLTIPKIGALMKQLIDAGQAQKHKHKKHILYARAGIDFVDPDATAEDEATEDETE